MGWWGFGVMEGDGPLDMRGGMQDAVVGEEFAEGLDPDLDEDAVDAATEEAFAKALKDPEAVSHAYEQCGVGDSDDPTDMQAFGYVVMLAGGPIDAFKQELLDALDADRSDEWTDPDKRRAAIAKFRQQVVNYDGTPIEDDTKGLFASIFEAIAEGQEGLINKT